MTRVRRDCGKLSMSDESCEVESQYQRFAEISQVQIGRSVYGN